MSERDPMDPGELTGCVIPRVDGGDEWGWSIENATVPGEARPRTSLLFDFDDGTFATEHEADAAMLRAAKHAHRRLGELIARLEIEAADE